MSAGLVPAGVYRGPKVDIAPVLAYEELLGHAVGVVLAFMADAPSSWLQFERATLASTTNGPPGNNSASDWVPLLGPRTLALAVPACCLGTTWLDEAGGQNDGHWTALGRYLVASGLGSSILRIGREFNQSWYPWKVAEGGQGAYRAAYARIVNLLRAVPGADFRFCWNPYLGPGNLTSRGTESCWPGAGAVDEVGLDVYDGDWSGIYPYPSGSPDSVTTGQQQKVWDAMLTEWDGLRGWLNVTRGAVPSMPVPAGGMPLSFPEWGLRTWRDKGAYHGGGDNAVLVAGMASFIAGCGAGWQGFWEDPLRGIADDDTAPGRLCAVPMARAAFLTAFGS